ncbi:MAG: hypothetical protein KKE96_05735 [Candidatus Altiarchaeota archaeon]|nr:hypothetical protein [Candidatus Altiarchaeota archaeon]MBU4266711.1 hypothetical protein [Candidatus Altiarchaeota archaeon]MBU4406322.1 hypothetical protein [Candidatus Altiarchaeota archaeon]
MVLKSKEEISKEKKKLFDGITQEISFADEKGRFGRLERRRVVLDLKYFPYRFMKESEKLMGRASTTLMYLVGKRCGKDIYDGYVEMGHDKDGALKLSTAGMWYFGWGLVDIDIETGEAVIYDSFEADSFTINKKRANTPTCHFFRGVISGIWAAYSGQECYGDETMCKAKGDKYCKIVVRATG